MQIHAMWYQLAFTITRPGSLHLSILFGNFPKLPLLLDKYAFKYD